MSKEYSPRELEKLEDYELENILFSIKTILNKRALDKLELEKKLKEREEKPAYKNKMSYYRRISDNFEKNYYLIGPGSWFCRTMTMELWNDYVFKFEEYIRKNYLGVKEELRPPFIDYIREPL